MEGKDKLKTLEKVLLIISTVLIVIGLLNAIFTVIVTEAQFQFYATLAIYALIAVYAFILYKKPHGNLLKILMLLVAASVGFFTEGSNQVLKVIVVAAAVLIGFISGRLNRIKQNSIIAIVITAVLLIVSINNALATVKRDVEMENGEGPGVVDVPQGGEQQGGVPQGGQPQGDNQQNGDPETSAQPDANPQGNADPQSSAQPGNNPQEGMPQGGDPQGNNPQGNNPQGFMQGIPGAIQQAAQAMYTVTLNFATKEINTVIRCFDQFILWAAVFIGYLARYRRHKEAGLEID